MTLRQYQRYAYDRAADSSGLWRHVNTHIALLIAKAIQQKQSRERLIGWLNRLGPKSRSDPVSLCNYSNAARAIRLNIPMAIH